MGWHFSELAGCLPYLLQLTHKSVLSDTPWCDLYFLTILLSLVHLVWDLAYINPAQLRAMHRVQVENVMWTVQFSLTHEYLICLVVFLKFIVIVMVVSSFDKIILNTGGSLLIVAIHGQIIFCLSISVNDIDFHIRHKDLES